MRYAHVDDAEVRAAMEKLTARRKSGAAIDSEKAKMLK